MMVRKSGNQRYEWPITVATILVAYSHQGCFYVLSRGFWVFSVRYAWRAT